MKRRTRFFLFISAFFLLAAPGILGEGYTIRFTPGTERIARQQAGGRNLDALTTLLCGYKPRLEEGSLAIRLTAFQSLSDRLDISAREQALLQAEALKDYLTEACCLGASAVFRISVDTRTDLDNRVIAEVVTHRRVVASRTAVSTPPEKEPSLPVSSASSATSSASVTPQPEALASAAPVPAVYRDGGVGFGIETNLLLFAGVSVNGPLYTPAPNLAVEGYFARRFSVRLGFACGLPYRKGDKENVSEVLSFSLEPRVWLRGDGSFRGLYGGLYGRYGTFDVRIKEKLSDNCKGAYVGVGVSVGWLQPLWKGLYASAGLQVGYRSDAVDVYEYASGKPNKVLAPYTLNSFTLQGANLSVGYRF